MIRFCIFWIGLINIIIGYIQLESPKWLKQNEKYVAIYLIITGFILVGLSMFI